MRISSLIRVRNKAFLALISEEAAQTPHELVRKPFFLTS